MAERASRRLSRLVTVAALLAAGYYGLFGGGYTMMELRQMRARVADQAAEVEELRAELDSLRVWGDSLVASPWAIERVARQRYGFVRPGELLVRFVDLNGAGAPAPGATPADGAQRPR